MKPTFKSKITLGVSLWTRNDYPCSNYYYDLYIYISSISSKLRNHILCLTKNAFCAIAIFKSLYETGPHQITFWCNFKSLHIVFSHWYFSHSPFVSASEKYIANDMLHKTPIKCCVRSYTMYFNRNPLRVPPYVVQKSNMLFQNYTTYENILHNIWQIFVQHMQKY